MVTHNWSNLFRDLMATVVADALGEHTFEFVAELLCDKEGLKVLTETLQVHDRLQDTYWICAFSVNQHAGICGANPDGDTDPVTKIPHPVCGCKTPKFFNKDPPLNDQAEAHRLGMAQTLFLRNKATLMTRQGTLEALQVENMRASRPEDVQQILSKIPNKTMFNQKLQELIFDGQVGLLAAWRKADVLQQMEDLSHLLKWARASASVDNGALIWRRWVAPAAGTN